MKKITGNFEEKVNNISFNAFFRKTPVTYLGTEMARKCEYVPRKIILLMLFFFNDQIISVKI